MATNWNAVLANITNSADILAILRKVLGLLDGKVDLTKIDEIIEDITNMQTNVDTALANLNSALTEFDAESQEAIQQVIAAGLMEGYATEAELLATRPTEPKKYAKAEDTDVIWFWNKPEGAPDGNYWNSTGLSELARAKEYTDNLLPLKNLIVGAAELVGPNPRLIAGIGVNLNLDIVDDIRYTAMIIPCYENTEVTLWNSNNGTVAGAGFGFTFHNAYPPSQANKITPHPGFHSTISGSDTLIHTRTPFGAKYIVVNKIITSLGLDLTWKIQNGYGIDKNLAFSPAGLMLDSKSSVSFRASTPDNYYSSTNNAVTGKYLSLTNGTIQDTSTKPNWKLAVIPVEAGVTYQLKLMGDPSFIKPSFLINTRSIAQNTVTTPATLISIGDNVYSCVAPAGATYLVMNLDLTPDYPNVAISSSLVLQRIKNSSSLSVTSIAGMPVADPIAQAYLLKSSTYIDSNIYSQSLNKTDWYLSIVNSTVQPRTDYHWKMAMIPVKPGGVYRVVCPRPSTTFNLRFTDLENPLVTNTATLAPALSTVIDDNNIEVVAPTGAKYLLINTYIVGGSFNYDITSSLIVNDVSNAVKTPSEISLLNGFSLRDNYSRKQIESLLTRTFDSILKGKKGGFIGDSITAGTGRSRFNYHYYLSQMVGGMTVYNYGISGTGFFNRYNVADAIIETDIDFLVVALGTNDWGNQTPENRKFLGQFGDTGTDTISGCINTTLTKLINKFPLIPLVLFTPLPRGDNYGLNGPNNAYGYNLKNLVDLLHQYATHFSLPIFDLYSSSTLYPWQPAANEYYFKPYDTTQYGPNPDGLHPNDEGHKVFAHRIKSFLESIQHK
ncbi:SGNH/GDSL hydrolase family protein [Acinetobacter baumannii]|uniref:SGNH/GDSL hydrolase family protein n=1 Tax=Acinetobacter baumannii TaxID=470 RepID=UPI0031D1706D